MWPGFENSLGALGFPLCHLSTTFVVLSQYPLGYPSASGYPQALLQGREAGHRDKEIPK